MINLIRFCHLLTLFLVLWAISEHRVLADDFQSGDCSPVLKYIDANNVNVTIICNRLFKPNEIIVRPYDVHTSFAHLDSRILLPLGVPKIGSSFEKYLFESNLRPKILNIQEFRVPYTTLWRRFTAYDIGWFDIKNIAPVHRSVFVRLNNEKIIGIKLSAIFSRSMGNLFLFSQEIPASAPRKFYERPPDYITNNYLWTEEAMPKYCENLVNWLGIWYRSSFGQDLVLAPYKKWRDSAYVFKSFRNENRQRGYYVEIYIHWEYLWAYELNPENNPTGCSVGVIIAASPDISR